MNFCFGPLCFLLTLKTLWNYFALPVFNIAFFVAITFVRGEKDQKYWSTSNNFVFITLLSNVCEIVSHPKALFSTLKQHSEINNIFPVQMQLAMVFCYTAMIIMKGRTCTTVAMATIWILEQTPNNDYCERFLSSSLLRKKYLSLWCQHSVRLVKLQLCNLVYIPDVVN